VLAILRLVDEIEDRAASLAGAIYGTIVVAGVLASSSLDDHPSAGATAIYAFATVLVVWLAEGWAHHLGHRAVGSSRRGGFSASLRRGWPLAQSALAPLAALAVGRLLGASEETAISIGVWTCVGLLVTWGATIEFRGQAPFARVIGSGAACGLLGLVMIALKAVLH
jgi:hypothetical protein